MTIQLYTQKETLNGKLTLSNKSLDIMDYCIISKSERDLLTNTSLTEILDKIYKSKYPEIKIIIKYEQINSENSINSLHKIEKSGELHRNKDKYNIYGYFIEEYPLEYELFYLVGKDVQIYLSYEMEDKEDAK